MSKISQIQDLFPDLGSGFVAKLLDAYDEDVEAATSALLEDCLRSSVSSLPRDLSLDSATLDPSSTSAIDDLIPSSTPPPQNLPSSLPIRHNIHDNDALDLLTVPSSQLHQGRRENLPSDPTSAHKASVLAALAAFDSDDDERDDTYDGADVGGTVDRAVPDGEAQDDEAGRRGARDDELEDALYAVWRGDRGLFGRSAEVRRGTGRRQLKERTGWTDEALEGWAVMLGRDLGRQRRLEERFVDGDGRGPGVGLERTRWSREDENGDGAVERGGMRVRGRGRGRGSGAGRGNVAGQAGERETQVARHRKEAGKSSRANHNRRDQRARKMTRGGFTG